MNKAPIRFPISIFVLYCLKSYLLYIDKVFFHEKFVNGINFCFKLCAIFAKQFTECLRFFVWNYFSFEWTVSRWSCKQWIFWWFDGIMSLIHFQCFRRWFTFSQSSLWFYWDLAFHIKFLHLVFCLLYMSQNCWDPGFPAPYFNLFCLFLALLISLLSQGE